ncbi:hypothetical protein MSAN_02136900 [Mycena sanguinolenta]|uniref:Uncharacterized protein n=1 Tax=Mycena sanguinolenta TaxID=230812 RepID=A0A8H6XH88_9AGAR|nr:hypothetical protein MSAN_02136900 [Mycena sanguinolenta]
MYAISTSYAEASDIVINSSTLEQYHHICYWNLGQYQYLDLSASTTVNLGTVFRYSGDLLEDSDEIAFLPSAEAVCLSDWSISGGGRGEVIPNGWTRFRSGDVFNNVLTVLFCISQDTWLSQANHIFCRQNIVSEFEEYVAIDWIRFDLDILETTGDPPVGFLFLCPPEDFRTDPSSFRRPAYWSLDPSGANRLSLEEATLLGFPPFELTTIAGGYSWDAGAYEGLRQFHEAKGFDPYSQDVARHLGYRLYQLSPQADASFANDSDGEDFDADIDSQHNSVHTEDYGLEYQPTPACDDSVSESTVEDDTVDEEMPAPSPTFRIVLYIQLMLILFLAVSGACGHI